MAYIRGRNYIWRDDERVHIWAAEGDDGWKESAWAEEVQPVGTPAEAAPSGVGIRQEVADLYVVMRLAQLIQEGPGDHPHRAGCQYLQGQRRLPGSRQPRACSATQPGRNLAIRSRRFITLEGSNAFSFSTRLPS